jgi:hypothetical protein
MEHQTRTHHKYSGSSAHRWLRCPGSATLCEQLPEQLPGAAALEGIRAHELLHRWSIEGVKALRECEDREMCKRLVPLMRYIRQQTRNASEVKHEEHLSLDGHHNAGS